MWPVWSYMSWPLILSDLTLFHILAFSVYLKQTRSTNCFKPVLLLGFFSFFFFWLECSSPRLCHGLLLHLLQAFAQENIPWLPHSVLHWVPLEKDPDRRILEQVIYWGDDPWNSIKGMGKWDREGKEDKIGYICEQITSVATWGSYPTGRLRMLYRTHLRVVPCAVYSSTNSC